MTVKIVTDSTADMPPELIKELGITVVPLYILFGKDTYKDGVDISEDDFFKRLQSDSIHPSTTQPTPKDFTEVYQRLASEADGIISIHISGKFSGTCNSALQGAKSVEKEIPIEVVDSQTVTMALGFIVKEAAILAKAGKNQQEVLEEVNKIIPSVHLLILFDTLKYLAKGGRIGKAKSLVGSMLNVKPLLTIQDGELVPSSQVRNRNKGIDKLFDFIKNVGDIQDLAIIHSTTPGEAQSLAERASSIVPKELVNVASLGAVLGVHGGPGVLAVAFRSKG
jgi:DegV family protein with EDD domain